MWSHVLSAFTRPLFTESQRDAPLTWCPELVPWPIMWYPDNADIIAGDPVDLQQRCRAWDAVAAVNGVPLIPDSLEMRSTNGSDVNISFGGGGGLLLLLLGWGGGTGLQLRLVPPGKKVGRHGAAVHVFTLLLLVVLRDTHMRLHELATLGLCVVFADLHVDKGRPHTAPRLDDSRRAPRRAWHCSCGARRASSLATCGAPSRRAVAKFRDCFGLRFLFQEASPDMAELADRLLGWHFEGSFTVDGPAVGVVFGISPRMHAVHPDIHLEQVAFGRTT